MKLYIVFVSLNSHWMPKKNHERYENYGGKRSRRDSRMRSKLMVCQPIYWSFFISLFADLPNLATKNISIIYPLALGGFVIAHMPRRHFIGEVLNMYKKGSNSCHNSIISTSSDSELSYISLRVHLLLVDNVGVPLVITIQVTGLTKLFAGSRFIRRRPRTSRRSCALVFLLPTGHSL